MSYRPRGMPARYMEGAPEIVRRSIIDILHIHPAAPLDFDVVFRPEADPAEVTGLDFDIYGARGCHFFLDPYQARAFRERNRHNRTAWQSLPEATQRSILRYLAED